MRILVPTDFSKCADDALHAAIDICRKLKGHLHLYHSAQVPDNWEYLDVEAKVKDTVNKQVALQAREALKKRQKIAENEGVECDIHYTGGKFLQNFNEVLEKVNVDLIVMGSFGTSGKREWFIGSNTQKVVRKFHKNVLVIKQEVQSHLFRKVVFVSSLNENDKNTFLRFLDFIRPFDIEELHLLAVNLGGYFLQPTVVMKEVLKDFKDLAKGFNCLTHFYQDYSVEAGIRHFCEENDIDLIGISNETRSPIKRILLGSNVEMVVNHASIPVLSLDK
ncbi:MAG: universal stress protein [Saprospiraceae bacterium]|nr:universal stress protein [Bacteroidia bacterium]MBT8230574.1 universal stress protein [Bacteroidia bacterium]NNF22869.1 universal stress protein [Saprospiraceae bacterium]NNK90054.1 universal stress protein [Saprospiraceae bacterium]